MSVLKFARASCNVIAVSLIFAYLYGKIPLEYETPAFVIFLAASIFSFGCKKAAYF